MVTIGYTIIIMFLFSYLIDPTILIIIIIFASGGLALMCITPIIIFVTCFYYRRKKGDMKHSTSYDNLIPEEEPDIDEDMYKHLKEEEERKGRKGRGIDIERRISQLEKEGLVDELSPTKKEIIVSYIDELDEGGDKEKEKQNDLLQKLNAKKPGQIISKDEPEKPTLEEEKEDLSRIDEVEPDDKEKEKESEEKSSNKAESDSGKKSWLKKSGTAKKPDPKKSKEKPTEKEEKKDISYIDEVEPDDKPKNEPKDKWQSAKQSSEDKKDISYIDDVEPETEDDKANLLQKWNAKKPGQTRSVVRDEKREDIKHKRVETDIQRRIRELQNRATN